MSVSVTISTNTCRYKPCLHKVITNEGNDGDETQHFQVRPNPCLDTLLFVHREILEAPQWSPSFKIESTQNNVILFKWVLDRNFAHIQIGQSPQNIQLL